MDEEIKNIIQHYTLNPIQIALLSVVVSVITFLITNYLKNIFENKLLQRKLEIEHKFDQQKKIKEVLAKNKVHLLTACEDLNHRMWNFANCYKEGWLNIKGDFANHHYYFHSFAYRFLAVYAWIKKTQKEMIFLDTTIATKNDMEFIKFLKVFPQIFCDLTFLEGKNADGNYADDHFFRNVFELLPDCIILENGIKSFSEYTDAVPNLQDCLKELYVALDGTSPDENRKRWDRLHLLNLTLIIFLNKYGYDFQRTDVKKMEEAVTKPKVSSYLKNYFTLLKEYRLGDSAEVLKLEKIAKKYYL
ncbi:hypothetical protein [Pedobacter alluvionis]|uniref:Uncharacterized protein n=1 Tax=Pedobacter alluvionis TaxID=475253 RepID=A0A497XNI2_9SPHI|nr:hypothetical protein [Pedobacter alluvionis]RLJ69575.1 hypothetical protein BCL90_5173 [Pedobacter alluvionis]TFB28365.1 hypothetical protein E3V97_23060 [Pedobacter alluvionis]